MPIRFKDFFDVPVDHLYASGVFLPYIESLQLEDLVIATPDVGGSKRASTYSKYLGVPLVLCNKTRLKANEVATMQIIGDVKNKNVILIDDMVDTSRYYYQSCRYYERSGSHFRPRNRFSLCNVRSCI